MPETNKSDEFSKLSCTDTSARMPMFSLICVMKDRLPPYILSEPCRLYDTATNPISNRRKDSLVGCSSGRCGCLGTVMFMGGGDAVVEAVAVVELSGSNDHCPKF